MPPLSGAGVECQQRRSSAVDNASGEIGFPERAGSAPLRRISPRTARQKCGRRLGSLGAFRGAELLSRAMGRFACPHSSASIASRVQVRATPRRISRTRELGADSAHCRHSAARSLHFSGLSIATPSGGPPIRKIKPRLDRGDQRGFPALGVCGCQVV